MRYVHREGCLEVPRSRPVPGLFLQMAVKQTSNVDYVEVAGRVKRNALASNFQMIGMREEQSRLQVHADLT